VFRPHTDVVGAEMIPSEPDADNADVGIV
jgi:hypothetical protein